MDGVRVRVLEALGHPEGPAEGLGVTDPDGDPIIGLVGEAEAEAEPPVPPEGLGVAEPPDPPEGLGLGVTEPPLLGVGVGLISLQ